MTTRVYRFAHFELNPAEGELRSGDSKVLIQEKPLLLLNTLLENPQRLVTRQQLRERMWGSRTVVDFEQGINVAVKKVRDALDDSAENPQFIETVAKKGYRLLVPVSIVTKEIDAPKVKHALPVADPATQAMGSATRTARRGRSFLAGAAIIALVLGVGLYATEFRPQRTPHIHSLAVLPLQDLSPDSGQEYLADGITEELITNLAQTLPLRVISRTSVMRYKRTDKPLAEIAKNLGVDAIVEGAVARSGDQVRVTVQLIDAAADRHLWARTYERRLEDILTIEGEVSRAIASQVGDSLGVQHAKLIKTPQIDSQVYQLCLLGRYHWNKRTAADLGKAEEYFQQAIARDPSYAPAYAGLASVYAMLPTYGAASFQGSFAKSAAQARAAAQRALALDESLAEAHATLGLVALSISSEWKQSEPEFRRAIELDANNASSHHWLAYYLLFAGRQDEALAEISLARQLDPLSAVMHADEGHFLLAARHFNEARSRLQLAIELEPELGRPHATLALLELQSGHPAEAAREAFAGLALSPSESTTMGEVGYVLASVGQTGDAKGVLARLKDLERQGSTNQVFSAMVEVGLGQLDQAVESLTAMVNLKNGAGLQGLSQWHLFDGLLTDDRIQKLMAQAQ
jgi:TolB-like protein/DNA-binding winged helix-turn-helix (wHTH) protein/Tfp pilus assembly protein PilF